MTKLPFAGNFRVTVEYRRMNTPRLKWAAGFHTGIDMVGDTNKTVYSVCKGTVIQVSNFGAYGKHIKIREDISKRVFLFAHLSAIKVKKGQRVTEATPIGIMGATGRVFGAHLHLEMRTPEDRYGKVGNIAEYMGIPNVTGSYNSKNFEIDPENQKKITYASHLQNKGWETTARANGALSGTLTTGLRIEAIIINAEVPIRYRVHMQDKGWGQWVGNGCMAGTIGEERRIEAIEVETSKYTLHGKAYVENLGWLPEEKGARIKIGTEGRALRLEGFNLTMKA